MTKRIKPSLIGRTFGRLRVIGASDKMSGNHRYWVCSCTCGTRAKLIREDHLRGGKIVSCRCVQRETTRNVITLHGDTAADHKSSEYIAWDNMWGRCTRPSAESFHLYGGCGVTVCEAWRKFTCFLADMGRKPTPTHSLDRINPFGNYEPSNCRWATVKEQANNKRNSPANVSLKAA